MGVVLHYAECVKYALHRNGIVEDDFENSGLRFYKRRVANPETVFKTLRKGGIIVPVIEGSLLEESNREFVATVLLSVSDDLTEVLLYNPFTGTEQTFATHDFMTAWDNANGGCTTAFKADGTYNPKLLDLTHVELPDNLDELCEAIAENAHDTWALERQSEGWTYGPVRNDEALETPDMVPYADLPDSEKQYDRIMAFDTLKLIVALGYNIVKAE